MSETWNGWIRAVWPEAQLALIRNENMNEEVRLDYKSIEGRIHLNGHGVVFVNDDGSIKFVLD